MEIQITDLPPESIRSDLKRLETALDQTLPPKVFDRNLLIATWNIRAFGNITKKWSAGEHDSPKRDFHAVLAIAAIVSRFHVVAIQEVRDNLRGLRYMLKVLGPHWGLIMTDVTKGQRGNHERMAFVFDTRVVQLSGLACELVIPPEQEQKRGIAPNALTQQFARTPYAVSFRAADTTFILITMHAIYGKGTQERAAELRAIAAWLAEWAKETHDWGQNLIVLGDFNIDRKGDPLYEAFTSTGLRAPKELDLVPRTIFSQGSDTNKFYDQIAWFTGEQGMPELSIPFLSAGNVDFVDVALPSRNLTKQQLSWSISDHYPLWAEFSLRSESRL